jgi:hypothetical protein
MGNSQLVSSYATTSRYSTSYTIYSFTSLHLGEILLTYLCWYILCPVLTLAPVILVSMWRGSPGFLIAITLIWIPASLIVYAWRYHAFIKSKRKLAPEQEEKV